MFFAFCTLFPVSHVSFSHSKSPLLCDVSCLLLALLNTDEEGRLLYPKQEGMMYTRSLLVHLSVLCPSLVPPYSLDLVILFRHPFSVLFSRMITHFAKYGNRLGDARAALHDKVGEAEKSERIDEKKVFLVSDSSLDRNAWPQSRVGPQVMSECLKRGTLKGG